MNPAQSSLAQGEVADRFFLGPIHPDQLDGRDAEGCDILEVAFCACPPVGPVRPRQSSLVLTFALLWCCSGPALLGVRGFLICRHCHLTSFISDLMLIGEQPLLS